MEVFDFSLLYMIVNIFSTYSISRLIRIFLGYHKIGKKILLFYLFSYLSDVFFYVVIGIPILILIQKIIMLLMLTKLYEGYGLKKIFTVISIYLFLLITETIVVLLTGYINHSIFQSTEYDSILGIIIIPIIQIMLIFLFEQYSNLKNKEEISLQFFLAIIFIPLVSIAMIFYILNNWNTSKTHLIEVLSYILTINFSIFYLYDSLIKTEKYKMKINLIEQEVNSYKSQIDIINFSQNALSNVRHDMINHSIMLYGLMIKEKNNEAIEYFNKILYKADLPSIIKTGRTDIDSILNFKILKAEQYDIKIEHNIVIPDEIKVNDFDMVIILGNLIDNAIEAVKNLPQEDRVVKINIKYDRLLLKIQTKNKFNGVYKIDKSGNLQTTNHNPDEKHGIGVLNIKKAVANYNGKFKYKIDDNLFFYTKILLYVEKYIGRESI